MQTAQILTFSIDVASSISCRLPPIANDNSWVGASSTSSPVVQTPSSEIDYLRNLLLFCTRVTRLVFLPSSNYEARSEDWACLYAQFQALQTNHGCQDMIEPLLISPINSISSSKTTPLFTSTPNSFPIHIYTSRLLFYCSFLEHLMCLLLIQSRPRKIIPNSAKSLKTAPWYAVQLCGMSLSNNELWSWDPVIISALIFAGSFLSYAGQQTELLKHLRTLEKMTGWLFKKEIQELGELWESSS